MPSAWGTWWKQLGASLQESPKSPTRIRACHHSSWAAHFWEVWGKILPVPMLMGLIEIRYGICRISHGLSMGWKNKESFFRAGQAGPQAFPGFWHTSLGHEHYALPGLWNIPLFQAWTPHFLTSSEHLQTRRFAFWMLIISGFSISSPHPFVTAPTARRQRHYINSNTEAATSILRCSGRSPPR